MIFYHNGLFLLNSLKQCFFFFILSADVPMFLYMELNKTLVTKKAHVTKKKKILNKY